MCPMLPPLLAKLLLLIRDYVLDRMMEDATALVYGIWAPTLAAKQLSNLVRVQVPV